MKDGRQESDATRESQLMCEIKRLESEMDSLANAIACIYDRLLPVLRESDATEAEESKLAPELILVERAFMIRQIRKQLTSLIIGLRNIIDRLEV